MISTAHDNPFWQFSNALYRQDGVAEALLRVQDEAGADVNLLLFAAWLHGRGQCLTPADLALLDEALGEWREQVVRPLRQVRRSLKVLAPEHPLRAAVQALELQAEQQQQWLMWQWQEGRTVAVGSLPDSLAAIAGYGVQGPPWQGLVELLQAAMVEMGNG